MVDDAATPALHRYFEVMPIEGQGVLVQSPDQGVRVTLEGVSAVELAASIRQLDGSRTVRWLRERHPDAHGIDGLLAALVDRDIVRTGPSSVSPSTGAEAYFAQSHDDPAACRRRLEASRIEVFGPGRISELIGQALRAGGVQHVRFGGDLPAAPPDGVRNARPRKRAEGAVSERHARADDLLIACPRTPRDGLLVAVADLASTHETPWLPVLIFGQIGLIGPLFMPGHGPCLECFWSREQAIWTEPELARRYYDALARDPSSLQHYGTLPAFEDVVSHWAVVEATRLLSRVTVPAVLGRLLRIDFMRAAAETHRVLKVPRCARCSSSRRMPEIDGRIPESHGDRAE